MTERQNEINEKNEMGGGGEREREREWMKKKEGKNEKSWEKIERKEKYRWI